MAPFKVQLSETQRRPEIFRVIDDGSRILTTSNPYVALKALSKLIEKHEVTACWVDIEEVKP